MGYVLFLSIESIEAQIPAGLRRLPEAITMGPRNSARYRAIAEFLQSRGVAVVGISIPYAPAFMGALEAERPGFGQAWSDSVAMLAQGSGIPFVDPVTFGPWCGEGSSQNLKHLSREGAIDFTHQLWDMPGFRERLLAGLTPAAP